MLLYRKLLLKQESYARLHWLMQKRMRQQKGSCQNQCVNAFWCGGFNLSRKQKNPCIIRGFVDLRNLAQ